MVPEFDFKATELEDSNTVSLTYGLDLKNKRIVKRIDDIEAMEQAIFKILSTERQAHIIYDDSYGVELERFIGKNIDFIKSDIERTISEALLADDRILSISNFTINDLIKDSLHIEFDVNTVYGNIPIKSEVNV